MTISLRQRITLLSLSLIALALLALTILFSRGEEKFVTQLNENGCRHLTETFSISITNSLLYEELGLIEEGGLIENYIDEWMQKQELPIRYIRVIDRKGRVFASNDLREYGTFPDDSLSVMVQKSDTTLIHYFDLAGSSSILEVSTPLNISTRSWGHLRVGYSLEPLHSKLSAIRWHNALAALIMIALSSVIVAVYLHKAISPLVKLRDFVDKAATESWLRYSINRNDEIGDLAKTFNIMLDRMEQGRELERETQEKFHQTERMSTIGKLAAGVAHEVRNPLAGILNLVENLERYQVDTEKRKQYIEVIRDGLKRIEKAVDGLVSFARQTPFSPTPSAPKQLMEDTLALAAYQLRKSRIEVVRQFEDNLPKIVVDEDQIRQVLLNILLNAIQAMEDSGGELTMGIKRADQRYLALYIEDTGVGFPKEMRKKIFDPFYTTQPVGKGTGLGLAVSRNIVQRHGGRIEVQSKEGKGSRFSVILPLKDERMNNKK